MPIAVAHEFLILFLIFVLSFLFSFFFFNDTATTEIYTLSLHDALPIFRIRDVGDVEDPEAAQPHGTHRVVHALGAAIDRKSTRLNSSHSQISYAVFCLKKKKTKSIHFATTQLHYKQ